MMHKENFVIVYGHREIIIIGNVYGREVASKL